MTQRSDTNGEPLSGDDGAIDPTLRDPQYLAFMAEHVTDLKRSVSGQRILYGSLAIVFVLGWTLQVVAYAIRSSLTPR
jgi:hypothetical protein